MLAPGVARFLWEGHREASWSRPLGNEGGEITHEFDARRGGLAARAGRLAALLFLGGFFGRRAGGSRPPVLFSFSLLTIPVLVFWTRPVWVAWPDGVSLERGGRLGPASVRARGGTNSIGVKRMRGERTPASLRHERPRYEGPRSQSRAALQWRPPYCNAAYSFEGDATPFFFFLPL